MSIDVDRVQNEMRLSCWGREVDGRYDRTGGGHMRHAPLFTPYSLSD